MITLPPRCPNPNCDHARAEPCARPSVATASPWFTRRGAFPRKDGSAVRRYECRACGRMFSDQTFQASYRERLPTLEAPLLGLLARGTSHRAAARLLGIDRKTVARRARRFDRARLLDLLTPR